MCISLLLITGCHSSYERNTNAGEVKTIMLSQLMEKMQNKDSFAVMFTQSMCGYCQEFESILSEYQQKHGFTMYNVILDNEEATPNENLAIIKPYFPEFRVTPGIFYVENGKCKSHLKDQNGTIDEKHLDDWVQENRIDKK